MNNNKTKASLKSKFKAFLTSLCTGPQATKNDEKKILPKASSIKKKCRSTFILQRALIKISRKNLSDETLLLSQVMSAPLEVYISSRIYQYCTVAFKGNFGDQTICFVDNPILISPNKVYGEKYTHSNTIKVHERQLPRFRRGAIDAMVFQLYFDQKGPQNKEIEEMERVLDSYSEVSSNLMFIVNKDLDQQHLYQLIGAYRNHYLFEIEKVMVLNNCLCSLIYVSENPQFLKIEDQNLAQFLMDQIANKDKEMNKEVYFKTLMGLFQQGLHVSVCRVLGEMLPSEGFEKKFYDRFIYVLSLKQPHSKILEQLSSLVKISEEHNQTVTVDQMTFCRNTPLFNAENRDNFNEKQSIHTNQNHSNHNKNQYSFAPTMKHQSHIKCEFDIQDREEF